MGKTLLAIVTVLLLASAEVLAEEGESRGPGRLRRTIRELSTIDTCYIEPQHFNYTIMLQATYNYDIYQIRSNTGQELTFAPDVRMKIGPYFGWRWVFLGYTFDLKNIYFGGTKQKREFDFSIYSSKIGIDLFYRRTGSDYKIRSADLGKDVDISRLNGVPFSGINVGITGGNLYYIFNHRRFSYPAAFSQSTRQKLSCGSWMAGVGYTMNSMSLDYEKLKTVVAENCTPAPVEVDSGLMFNGVRYYNLNVSGGYAYNWVFAKNWLFCASGALAVAYKHSKGDMENMAEGGFNFDNVNLDGIGRFGLVYNNNRAYAGLSAIIRTNNYRKPRFSSNEVFGNINIYVGYNFGKKSYYRKKKK